MFRAAITFFIIALVAYMLGAYGIAGLSTDIGKVLLMVFLVLAVVSAVAGLVTGKRSGPVL